MEVVASTRGTSHPGLWSRTRSSDRWSQATPVASKAERLLSLKAFQHMSDATSRQPYLVAMDFAIPMARKCLWGLSGLAGTLVDPLGKRLLSRACAPHLPSGWKLPYSRRCPIIRSKETTKGESRC